MSLYYTYVVHTYVHCISAPINNPLQTLMSVIVALMDVNIPVKTILVVSSALVILDMP